MKGLYRRSTNGWPDAALPARESAQGTGKYREEREHEPETDRTNSK